MIETQRPATVETIKNELDHIYGDDPWYGGSIKAVLDSLNPTFAFHSPGYGMHSVAELVAHMISWREFAEQRLAGNNEYLPDQEQTFNWKRFSPKKKMAWEIMKNRLQSNQQALLGKLEQADNSLLHRKVPGKPYTFYYMLMGILQHDVYHLGQIVYIHKLLNKKKGIRAGVLNYSFRVFPYEVLAKQK